MLLFLPRCSSSCFNYTANAFAQLHVALWCPCMAKFDRVGDENGGWYHEQGGYTNKLGSHLQSRASPMNTNGPNGAESAESGKFRSDETACSRLSPKRIASSVGREPFFLLPYAASRTAIVKSERFSVTKCYANCAYDGRNYARF